MPDEVFHKRIITRSLRELASQFREISQDRDRAAETKDAEIIEQAGKCAHLAHENGWLDAIPALDIRKAEYGEVEVITEMWQQLFPEIEYHGHNRTYTEIFHWMRSILEHRVYPELFRIPAPNVWPMPREDYKDEEAWKLSKNISTDRSRRASATACDIMADLICATDRERDNEIPDQAETHDKDDTKDDKKKKAKKIWRPLTDEAKECARLYRKGRKEDPKLTKKSVVESYVAENGGSFDSIMRTLADHPELC